MFSAKFAVLSAVLVASASAFPSNHVERNVHHSVPAQFQKRDYARDAELLEPYKQYNERYMDFNCPAKHGTDFFDSCCHPRLKEHANDDFPDQCYSECDDDDGENGGESSAPADIPATQARHTEAASTQAPANVAKPTSSKMIKTTSSRATSQAAATTSHQAAPTTSAASGGNGGSGAWNTGGVGTYYLQGGQAGACGTKHSDSDFIVAIDIERYGDTGRQSSLCGKKVRIVNTANNKEVTATIADVCPTCEGNTVKNSIDMSVGAFTQLATKADGMINIKWQFV